uniref:cAMP-dependent protein kinase type II regulatory subunit n=1 Tax=Lygus hesperus TaxID=30085 RepID=A0A0A9WBB3_LYGHE
MEELHVTAGKELIREGDDNYGFYVIGMGEYEIRTVSSGVESVKRVNSGTFGELTLLHNQNSRSTVTAKTNGKLYSLDRNDFRKIVTKTTHELRKNLEEIINKVPLLKDLTEFDKLKVADVLELINFSDGDVIVKEGECSDGVYLVVHGSVKIVEKTDSGRKELTVGSGEHFGELPASKPASACKSAVAVGQTKVAFLKAEAYERLMGPCLKVLKKNPSHSRKPATNL